MLVEDTHVASDDLDVILDLLELIQEHQIAYLQTKWFTVRSGRFVWVPPSVESIILGWYASFFVLPYGFTLKDVSLFEAT